MKRKRHFLIRTALALFMVLCSVWGWGQVTIAGWTFPGSSGAAPLVITANCGTGTIYADGTNGSSVWLSNTSNYQFFAGYATAVANQTCGEAAATQALSPTGSSNNGKAIVFKLSTLGFEDLKLTYDTRSSGGSGFTTQTWAYSIDGINFTNVSTITGYPTSFNANSSQVVDFNSIPASDDQPNLYVRIILSGATAASGNNRIDNIKFLGTALPTCTTPTYSFADATINKTTADAPFTNVFTTDNTSPTAYNSSHTNVATVNATTGEVTIVGAGTTTIMVTQDADGNYCEVSDSYTLNVTSSSPSLAISGNTDNGATCINTPAAVQTYTVTNTGNSSADGLTVVSDNSQFVVSNLSATTVSGSNGTVTFDVTFTPTSAGVQNATITVQSSTSGSNVATFDITGTGNTTVDPALATSAATSISATEATLNGDITSLGTCLSNPLTEKGFVYGTASNPESNGGAHVSDGAATAGTFDVVLNSLSPATTYYYKAYVKDGNNQYYYSTNEETFTTTLDAPLATAATNITPAGFTANWNAVTGADSYVLEVNEVSGSVTPNVTVVGWDFEDQDIIADSGITDNLSQTLSTNAGAITYSQGAPNAGFAANASSWSSGSGSKYWMVSFTTAGMSNMKLSSKQRSSGTGPRDFKVQYSIDNNNWSDIFAAEVTVGNNFSDGVLSDLVLPSTLNNQALVYLRWIMTSNTNVNGTSGTGGTSRIDDIIITGDQGTFSSTPVTGSPFTITAPATSYDVTGLNPDADYTYTVKAVKGTVESAVSNTINVTTSPAPASTTYAGGSWSNGAPNSPDTDAVISENYNGAGFTAKDITVSSGASLTITSTETITAANITVEDNANFIQEDGSTLNLTGTMTLNKNATSDATKYVFWSSPVQNQNVYGIYPAGTPQFVMTYNSDTDLYPTVANPTIAAAGVGYSVKVPVSATAAQFIGAPNSGDIPVSLDHVANANGNTWNLIGNPYPSNLNLQSLYNGGGIGSSIYFWDNISATNTTQQQAATTWAVYNAANGTWSNTGNAGLGIDGNNNLVKPGQGFIVQATAPSITFTNAMRSAATANFINKGMNPGEGKFWLKLATPSGTQFQTAITYGGGALNTLEAFDSKVMSVGANGIYSYLGTDKLAIQGRDYFVNTDVVILGNKHSASGQYTFSLAGKTGLFDAGQAIYLKDKQTNIYTNLQTDSYTFLSDALEQQDRFEIVYQPQAALGTSETVKTETVVYKDGDHFTVKASEKILSIEVYDASGRHIGTVKPDSTTAQVTVGSRGMYLLKIKTVNSETVKKVIK